MEKVESTICFEYYLSGSKQNDEKDHNYNVAEYAVDQCQWSGEQANQKDSTVQKPQQKQWRGYKILDSSDVIETPLFDRSLILDKPRRIAAATTTTTTRQQKKC